MGRSQLTRGPVGQFGTMTPLARNGPKLRPEFWRLAQIPSKALDLGSLFPVALSGCHVAVPSR
jgi:hypothetical protein